MSDDEYMALQASVEHERKAWHAAQQKADAQWKRFTDLDNKARTEAERRRIDTLVEERMKQSQPE